MTKYPDGITASDHIAHDMKQGRFPEQSSVETFLAERAAWNRRAPACEELRKAAQALSAQWRLYLDSTTNQQDAYYLLARHHYEKWAALDAALAALAATPEPTADRGGEVSVKPLEWRDHGPDAFPARFWSAQTPFGRYEIEEETASDSPRYRLEWHSSLITDEDGLDAAKAAAQADYEQRIRSALTPTDKG